MLERASTCLESGGRQLFRAPTPCLCLRSRPAPYAAFRHHTTATATAATTAAAPDCSSGDVDDGTADPPASPAPPAPATTLDFLYPEKTLELIRRLSTAAHNVTTTVPTSASRRPRSLPLASVRQYSTASLQSRPTFDDSVGNTAAAVTDTATQLKKEKRREFQDHVRDTVPSRALKELLSRGEPGKQDLAWRLWVAITPDEMTKVHPHLMREFLAYALADSATLNMKRILQVFHTIPQERRTVAMHRSIVLAYLSLDRPEAAVKFHDEAQLPDNVGFEDFDLGTGAILRRTVSTKKWALSVRAFGAFLRHKSRFRDDDTVNRIQQGDPLLQVWGQVAQLPELQRFFQEFLQYVRQSEQWLRSSQERSDGFDLFVQSFLPHIVPRVLHDHSPDDALIWDNITKLFDDLQSLKLALPSCYECTIKAMLNTPRYRDYTHSPLKPWLLLYRRYRQELLDSKNSLDHAKPSYYIIRRLIAQQALHGNLERVRELVQDIRTFYPGQPIPAGILEQCIHLFSKHGEAAQVNEYFEEYRSSYSAQIDLKLLSALVYVHARRIDVLGAIKQFNRIRQDYGLTPDQACWNILLLAHVRAEDLDGALECFNDSLDAGIKPDIYAYGPMLDMCASRGDIEAFEALYSRAKQTAIPLDTNVRARSAYVQVFLNADDPEGAEAIAQDMLRSWKAGVLKDHPLTHTWNIMIQHYALKGDVTSSRRLYREMVQNKIPLDGSTYSHLMRSLIEIKQTNAAYKILRKTIPANNLRVLSIHYAIVMIGFLKERQYDLAKEAYERMIEREVAPTESSRTAALQTVGTIEKLRLQKKRKKFGPYHRMKDVETLVRKMLASGSGRETAHYQPRTGQFIDVHVQSGIPASYYGLLIKLYSARGAYQICEELIDEARKLRSGEDGDIEPISFLTAIMEFHYKRRNIKEVEMCWNLALKQAHRLAKTFHNAVHPEADIDADSSLSIAPNRHQALVHPARIYLRSLATKGGSESLQKAQHTVKALLADGFVINNLTWNELVQALATGGRVTDAFAICEKYLMPRFPGWREQNPRYIRNERPGYTWMDIRHYDIERNGLLPRYKTMVVLAKNYAVVRREEREGIGFNEVTRTWLRESLDNVAPLTIRAIETMPRMHDRLQLEWFRIS
jgi:pentatricopeptide repeat-containing protein PET309